MSHLLKHFLHAAILAFILYAVMVYGLQQSPYVAQQRSILVGAIAFVYMMVFGHRLPRM